MISVRRKHVVAATGSSAIHSGRIPPHGHLQPGTEDSAIPLTTPDMVRSGRVLQTSVKSPFKVGDNQRPERTGAGVQKPTPESSVPGDNLDRGSRRNQLRRGHGSPPVLSEVSYELSTDAHSKECKRSPQQFIPAGFPPHDNLQPGTEDSEKLPLATPAPVRSGRVLHPQLLINLLSPCTLYIPHTR